ncbi:uncharacterized protein LOC114076947 isoform X2 [Solanum pennellii]|nr:uncharacterized protein LOC114076947 isoform X2 [Solanum pennellii]XP_027772548.1 uncharacterized protein LOC114076947 isoform X2 [Solanum pennellii]XP_027772549.1 uncharacterized protein LOC114076947 isoform X2 [Solanum pennellii]
MKKVSLNVKRSYIAPFQMKEHDMFLDNLDNLLKERLWKKSTPDGYISYVRLLADQRYCAANHQVRPTQPQDNFNKRKIIQSSNHFSNKNNR